MLLLFGATQLRAELLQPLGLRRRWRRDLNCRALPARRHRWEHVLVEGVPGGRQAPARRRHGAGRDLAWSGDL